MPAGGALKRETLGGVSGKIRAPGGISGSAAAQVRHFRFFRPLPTWHPHCPVAVIMTPHPSGNPSVERRPMMPWMLQRGKNAITCRLDARGKRSYELCVLPHWDPSSAIIERFDASTSAFMRHAKVASLLRENGWMVINQITSGAEHGGA
jgi:hypothetical protein